MLEADEAANIEQVRAWAAGLEALHARIAGRFARAEPPTGAGLPARPARQRGPEEWLAAGRARRRAHPRRHAAAAEHRRRGPDQVRDDLRS